MDLLNDIYRKSCEPKCESYTKIDDNIILIDNFFENFKSAKNFFAGRDKWKCIPYQELAKPGYESFFPNWVGRSLMEKFCTDNKKNMQVFFSQKKASKIHFSKFFKLSGDDS